MRPACGLPDRAGLAVREIELFVAIIGVGLQDAGVVNEMRLRALACPIARGIEQRRRRPGAAERPVVVDVNPEPAGVGLALRQHWHGRVVAVEPLGRHHLGLDELQERIERRRDRADGVGHGGERDQGALERIALGLPVQRLALAELLEHDHRQQARARPGPRDRVERRRRLADLFAIPGRRTSPAPFRSPSTAAASSPASASRPRRACAGDCRSTRRRSADQSPPARAEGGRGTCRARRAGG